MTKEQIIKLIRDRKDYALNDYRHASDDANREMDAHNWGTAGKYIEAKKEAYSKITELETILNIIERVGD